MCVCSTSHLGLVEFFAVSGMPEKTYGEVCSSAVESTTWAYCISLDVQHCIDFELSSNKAKRLTHNMNGL